MACPTLVVLVLAAFCLAAPNIGCGQTTIKVDVKQVLVPVVVTDKAGHHVNGLNAADFYLYEDGIEQNIIGFAISKIGAERMERSEGSSSPSEARSLPSKPSAATLSPQRTYLICIDTLHSTFANFSRVREALRKFIAKEEAGDSQYALMAIGWQIHVIVDSTRDPSSVLAAITSKTFLKTITETESAKLTKDIQEFTSFMRDDYCRNCACEAFNTSEHARCPVMQARLQGYLLRSGERLRTLDESLFQALRQLVTATATMPTTRTILFISDGFNRSPGRELYSVMAGFAPKDRRFEFNPRDTNSGLHDVLKAALNQDVRFYTIDSRGLYTIASLGGSTFDASTSEGAFIPQAVDSNMMTVARENTDTLAELAHETGGFFFENNNDLFKGIERAFADSREYYVLAYVPKNKLENGTFRRLSVEVAKRNLRVNAKAGYWAPSK